MSGLSPLDVCPENIWEYRQNKVKYVVNDLEKLLALKPAEAGVVRKVLLARGVNKWLGCRRDIIQLKEAWKREITALISEIREAKANKDEHRRQRLVGRWEALNEARQGVRAICHSERYRVIE